MKTILFEKQKSSFKTDLSRALMKTSGTVKHNKKPYDSTVQSWPIGGGSTQYEAGDSGAACTSLPC